MFHGPACQGVTTLGPSAANGISGEITTPAAPGALLDNAGQLMGYWLMRRAAIDRLAFPSTIRRISFHGPAPRAGDRLACSAWIRQVTDATLRADLELRDARGIVWARIESWEDRRFSTDEVTWPVLVNPEWECVAAEQPGGWFLVRERWDAAMRELMMRRYLTTAERAEYESYDPRTKRQWLLGRMAVKDAVRRQLWESGAGPIFPIEIAVTSDASGRSVAHGPRGERVDVSYAQTPWLGAAALGPDPDAAARHLAAHRDADPGDATEHDTTGQVTTGDDAAEDDETRHDTAHPVDTTAHDATDHRTTQHDATRQNAAEHDVHV
jgi:hypothetical protein